MSAKLETPDETEYTTISVSKDFLVQMRNSIPKSYSYEQYLAENLDFEGDKNE